MHLTQPIIFQFEYSVVRGGTQSYIWFLLFIGWILMRQAKVQKKRGNLNYILIYKEIFHWPFKTLKKEGISLRKVSLWIKRLNYLTFFEFWTASSISTQFTYQSVSKNYFNFIVYVLRNTNSQRKIANFDYLKISSQWFRFVNLQLCYSRQIKFFQLDFLYLFINSITYPETYWSCIFSYYDLSINR